MTGAIRHPARRCFGRSRPAKGLRFHLSAYNPNTPRLAQATTATAYRMAPGAAGVLRQTYLNLVKGTCTIASRYHLLGLREAAAGASIFIASDDQIEADYTRCGGDPGDEGCDEDTVLGDEVSTGYANGDHAAGFLEIDGSNIPLVRACLTEFVGLAGCLEVPDSCMQAVPATVTTWTDDPAFAWDVGTPNPNSGHAVPLVDQDDGGLHGDTWGEHVLFTFDAVAGLMVPAAGGSLAAVLDEDMIAQNIQRAPDGLDWAALVADWSAMGGTVAASATDPARLTLIEKVEAWLKRHL
jgi:hypothetical protein